MAPTWESARGELQLFARSPGGNWEAVSEPFPVLLGKNGVAWGRGLAGQNEAGLQKKERDGRAPAGVFEIGKVFGYDPQLPPDLTIRIIRSRTQTFGAMILVHRITIAIS